MVLTTSCLQIPVFPFTTRLLEYLSILIPHSFFHYQLMLQAFLIWILPHSSTRVAPSAFPLEWFGGTVQIQNRIYNIFCQTCFFLLFPVLVNGSSQKPWHCPLFFLLLFCPTSHPFIHQVLSFLAPCSIPGVLGHHHLWLWLLQHILAGLLFCSTP